MNFLSIRLPLPMLAPAVLMFCAAQDTPRQPKIAAVAGPTPTPKGFWVEVADFDVVPTNPFNAALGADTCVNVVTYERQAPPNVRWFFNRRLVATKDGKTRVLWDDSTPGLDLDTGVGILETFSDGVRIDDFVFNLRDVPVAEGEITFEWDALVQPSQKEEVDHNSEFVSLTQMDKLARDGDARLSRKLVLRRDGEEILKPTFAAKPPLRLLGVQVQPQDKPDDSGYDMQVVMRLAYEGDEAKPEISAPDGLELKDDKGQEVERSFQDEATREGQTQTFCLEASVKSADLKKVRFLSVEANISDGKSWPMRFKEGLDLLHARK